MKWMRQRYNSICRYCEYSNLWPWEYEGQKCEDDKSTCLKGEDIEASKEICRYHKMSKKKYYHKGLPQKRYATIRAELKEKDDKDYYLQSGELFVAEYRRYERRKLEVTISLECAEEYLLERFGKPRITLKVNYDFRELKLVSIEAYADGEKFDCPLHEKDIEIIKNESYYTGKRVGCIRESFIGEGFGNLFGLCGECEYSNIWPQFYIGDKDDGKCDVLCLKGIKGDRHKYVCQSYKRNKEKHYCLDKDAYRDYSQEHYTERRMEALDDNDEIFELQFREIFEVDRKAYENGQIDIEFSLECTEEFLMRRFGKPRIGLRVRYDCNTAKILHLESFSDGEKFDCPFHEEDLSAINDESYNVGVNIGYIMPPAEWGIFD